MIRSFAKIRNLLPFVGAILLLVLALWFAFFPQFPLSRYKLSKMHAENEELGKLINQTIAANKLMFTDLAHYRTLYSGAMNQPEQTAMVVFRERIDTAATAAGLKSRTIGNIRSVVIEKNVLLFDVAFSAEGTLAEVVAFLKSAEEEKPHLSWRSISLQPGKESFISLSGTLCALSFPSRTAATPETPAPPETPQPATPPQPASAPQPQGSAQ